MQRCPKPFFFCCFFVFRLVSANLTLLCPLCLLCLCVCVFVCLWLVAYVYFPCDLSHFFLCVSTPPCLVFFFVFCFFVFCFLFKCLCMVVFSFAFFLVGGNRGGDFIQEARITAVACCPIFPAPLSHAPALVCVCVFPATRHYHKSKSKKLSQPHKVLSV